MDFSLPILFFTSATFVLGLFPPSFPPQLLHPHSLKLWIQYTSWRFSSFQFFPQSLQLTHSSPFLSDLIISFQFIYPISNDNYLRASLHSSSFSWILALQHAGSLNFHTWWHITIKLCRAKAKHFPLRDFYDESALEQEYKWNSLWSKTSLLFLLAYIQIFKHYSNILSNIS